MYLSKFGISLTLELTPVIMDSGSLHGGKFDDTLSLRNEEGTYKRDKDSHAQVRV